MTNEKCIEWAFTGSSASPEWLAYRHKWWDSHSFVDVTKNSWDRMRGFITYKCKGCGHQTFVDSSD